MQISIHAPHTGHDVYGLNGGLVEDMISIHAPHTGHDKQARLIMQHIMISIHAPHTGHDSKNA